MAQNKQNNPTVLTVWTSGFTGHIANASLRNARLATLVETLLKANYSTLQDFSVILSGLVLIQTYKSSNVLSAARKMHHLLSLAKSTRKSSSTIFRSTASRSLGLSLHFSAIAASKARRQSKLISSIFGAQSKTDGFEEQEHLKGLNLVYQFPGGIGASLLREDAESESFSYSKATNIPFSLSNQESQDSMHDVIIGSTFFPNHSESDMKIRAAEGEVVRDASDIGLNDLDMSQATPGNNIHESLMHNSAFNISNSSLLEATQKLTNLFMTNTSHKSSEVTVIAKEIKDPIKKRNAAANVEKRTTPPLFLFDKQARMHHNTMLKYSYKPTNSIQYSLHDQFKDGLHQDQEKAGTIDLMFNWFEPEYHALMDVISKNWELTKEDNAPGNIDTIATPIEYEEGGIELEPDQNYVEPETLLLNDPRPVQEDVTTNKQNGITESGQALLSILERSSRPLTISELAGSSRQKAASLFVASLALRANTMITIKQCCNISLQREISVFVSSH